MDRAGEPIDTLGPTWGSLVPGLGPYMATRNALNAYRENDVEAAVGHAGEAAMWLMPAGVARKVFPYGARPKELALPIAPGMNAAGTTPEDRKRAMLVDAIKYNNPALTSEYWQEKGINGFGQERPATGAGILGGPWDNEQRKLVQPDRNILGPQDMTPRAARAAARKGGTR